MIEIETALEAHGLVPTFEIDALDEVILNLSHKLLDNIPVKHTAITTRAFWDNTTPEQISSNQAQWAAPVLIDILTSDTPPDADFVFDLPDPRELPRSILEAVRLVYIVLVGAPEGQDSGLELLEKDCEDGDGTTDWYVGSGLYVGAAGGEIGGAYGRVHQYREPVQITDMSKLMRPRLESGDKILAIGTLVMCEKRASLPHPLHGWMQLMEGVFTHAFWTFRVAEGSSLSEGPWSYCSEISPWSAEDITWDGLSGHSPMREGLKNTDMSTADWDKIRELTRQQQAERTKRYDDKIKLAKEYLQLRKDGENSPGDNKAVDDLLYWYERTSSIKRKNLKAARVRKQAKKELAREYREREEAGEIDIRDNTEVKDTLEFLESIEIQQTSYAKRRVADMKLAKEYVKLEDEGKFDRGDNKEAKALVEKFDKKKRQDDAYLERIAAKGRIAREFLKREAAGEAQRGDNKEVDEAVLWWEGSSHSKAGAKISTKIKEAKEYLEQEEAGLLDRRDNKEAREVMEWHEKRLRDKRAKYAAEKKAKAEAQK